MRQRRIESLSVAALLHSLATIGRPRGCRSCRSPIGWGAHRRRSRRTSMTPRARRRGRSRRAMSGCAAGAARTRSRGTERTPTRTARRSLPCDRPALDARARAGSAAPGGPATGWWTSTSATLIRWRRRTSPSGSLLQIVPCTREFRARVGLLLPRSGWRGVCWPVTTAEFGSSRRSLTGRPTSADGPWFQRLLHRHHRWVEHRSDRRRKAAVRPFH